MAAGPEDAILAARRVAGREVAILAARMAATPEDAILEARTVAGQGDAIPAARRVASQEVAILAARRVADLEAAILEAPMAAGPEAADLEVPMAAGREVVILAARRVASQTDAIPAVPTVAVRKIADPADALLSVASRRDVQIRCVGSTGVLRRPSTGHARAVFPLHAPDHRHPAVVALVDRHRPALEDADPKTEAPTGVGLKVPALTVGGPVDEPPDRAVRSGRWAPADRASASWARHQVVRSRRRVDPVAVWPRSAAAFHLAER